ncbi:hypothetical protein BJ742DRAFT_857291 [Cladochytrium replicatum]|nr:hypothetical protein BJ742DRAFT_857291 [Cladochytrium replicatum]
MPIAHIIRDRIARQVVAEHEVARQALRLIIRDESHPLSLRIQAQLQLNNYPRYARPHAIKNRCVETGKARGNISEYKISRIVFRQRALAGEIPGVRKACW